MVDRERLRDELRRVKRALSSDPDLRARYGLAPGAPVTMEVWDQVEADVEARLAREATSEEESPVGAHPVEVSGVEAPQDDWEAHDAEARARLLGESPIANAPTVVPAGATPALFEEEGDARWLAMGGCLLASVVLPWVMGGGRMVWSWDAAGQSGWLAFFMIFALLAGLALLVIELVPAVGDALDFEKRELIGGGIGVVGLLTCTGDLFSVQSPIGALLGRILLISLFGLMVGLHARVNTPDAPLSRMILGVSAALLLVYYLFPQPLPGLTNGGESWQVPVIFIVRLFFLSFDAPLSIMLLIAVPTLLTLIPFPAAALGVWSAYTEDERLDGYLEAARKYVTFVLPAALVFMGAFSLLLPISVTLLIWAGANIAVYLLLATEGVSRVIARIAEGQR